MSVQKVEVDGDTATVTLRSPGSDSGGFDVIRMVREHGGWKVRDL